MSVIIAKARHIDAHEIISRTQYAGSLKAEYDLQHFVEMSITSWIGYIDDEIACVWGLIAPTLLSETAYLWLLTTKLIDEHPFVFVRHSQMILEDILKEYPLIRGHVQAGSKRSIRWLKWLGATLKEREKGMIKFEIRRKLLG